MTEKPESRPGADRATSTTVLMTGGTGKTGNAAVRHSLALGLDVRAMVHSIDERSQALADLGAEVVVGDMLEINSVRQAIAGTDAAYFVYPIRPGLMCPFTEGAHS